MADPGMFSFDDPNFGAQAARIEVFCRQEAARACPRASIACDSYRQSYVPTCMQVRNVPPAYILLAR